MIHNYILNGTPSVNLKLETFKFRKNYLCLNLEYTKLRSIQKMYQMYLFQKAPSRLYRRFYMEEHMPFFSGALTLKDRFCIMRALRRYSARGRNIRTTTIPSYPRCIEKVTARKMDDEGNQRRKRVDNGVRAADIHERNVYGKNFHAAVLLM